jgi:6-phospho-3-hexuloisomerase
LIEVRHFTDAYSEILGGVFEALRAIDPLQVEDMLKALIKTRNEGKKLLVVGAGRSGLIGKAFAMRLMHLGINVYVMGETITPAFGEGDLLLVISGSGSTSIPVTVADMAHKLKATVISVTSHPDSPLGRVTDLFVVIAGRSKVAREDEYIARQLKGEHESLAPMGTLFEDTCMIFLDSIIAELMARLEVTESDMIKKHATI